MCNRLSVNNAHEKFKNHIVPTSLYGTAFVNNKKKNTQIFLVFKNLAKINCIKQFADSELQQERLLCENQVNLIPRNVGI